MQLAKENKSMIVSNIEKANKRIKNILRDQFNKLRNAFEENLIEENTD